MNSIKAKAIRLYLNESQEKFAKRIGVSPSTVCSYEKNQRDITDRIRAKLAMIERDIPEDFYRFFESFKNSV